jgi:hypothetical protein
MFPVFVWATIEAADAAWAFPSAWMATASWLLCVTEPTLPGLSTRTPTLEF